MSQSRKWSAVETAAGTAIGFVVAYITTALLFPPLGLPVSSSKNLVITAIFTVVSLVRGYYVRRLFNWIHSRAAQR